MFTQLLQRASKVLKRAGIPYAIMGGQAVLLYGDARVTKDIDITLGLLPDELQRVLSAIQEAQWEILVPDAETFVRDTYVLPARDKDTGIRLDLLFSFTEFERHAIEHAVDVDIGGVDVRFVKPEDLVVHKVFAGRPRDIEDVRSILAKNMLDQTYIRQWLAFIGQGLEVNYVSRYETILADLDQ